jgi:hypothetical protein
MNSALTGKFQGSIWISETKPGYFGKTQLMRKNASGASYETGD